MAQRIVANFSQYYIIVRNWRNVHETCILELILKRDNASFAFRHEMVMNLEKGNNKMTVKTVQVYFQQLNKYNAIAIQ